MRFSSFVSISLLAVTSFTPIRASPSPFPNTTQVEIKNGTIQGFQLPAFGEDVFFGVPFAAPPIGDLRLRHPKPHQTTWQGVRDATVRSPSCPGYSGFDAGLSLGEGNVYSHSSIEPCSDALTDCLTLDIVRPSGTNASDRLPVLVWIYGGAFDAGGSADLRYNTSYLVNSSVAINKPIIVVSVNYRVGGWGFLASNEVAEAGESNIGLFDQRLALEWINENIQAFGGDPDAVTIAGESAGAFSIGYHLTAFDGKHDGLFRAVIMESGNSLGSGRTFYHCCVWQMTD